LGKGEGEAGGVHVIERVGRDCGVQEPPPSEPVGEAWNASFSIVAVRSFVLYRPGARGSTGRFSQSWLLEDYPGRLEDKEARRGYYVGLEQALPLRQRDALLSQIGVLPGSGFLGNLKIEGKSTRGFVSGVGG
jgi:hypothetical protein